VRGHLAIALESLGKLVDELRLVHRVPPVEVLEAMCER